MLRLLPPNSVPVGNLLAVPVNLPVLLFSAGLAMASALIFGLSPALSFFAPTPDGDCPDDRRRRKPASASPPATFYERLRDRMAEAPQVESVALATYSGIPP